MKAEQIYQYLELIDTITDDIGIAQEIGKINVALTATNRGAEQVHDALEEILTKKIQEMEKDIKKHGFYHSLDQVKIDFYDDVYALIRRAIQDSYQLGMNYVAKATKTKVLFLSITDINNIANEAERINNIFWERTFSYLTEFIMQERMKNMPIGLGGFFDTIKGIVRAIADVASFNIVQKSTRQKLKQLPVDPTTDPETGLSNVKKRVLVFVTKTDEKVCPICERYEGVEYEEDDPFIVRPIDDTHPNCRCRLLLKVDDDIVTG